MRLRPVAVATALLVWSLVGTAAQAGGAGLADHRGPTPQHSPETVRWTETVVDVDQSFRGLDAVDRSTAWVTGGSVTHGAGRVFRTVDGGLTWHDVSPTGTIGLSFRDVEASSAKRAVILAVGPGDTSRIYRTTDGGTTWLEAFVNDDPAAFYDCMAFYPGGKNGLVMGDPVNGKFRVLATHDFGRSWSVLPDAGMPAAPTEYGFAASGDCLVTVGHSAYFGSGGGAARIYRSDDLGHTWTAAESTIPAGDSAGVFALAFRAPGSGVAVGGDFASPANGANVVATIRRGEWRNAGDLTHLAEDVAYTKPAGHALIATGESGDTMGTSLSVDGGASWIRVSDTGYHALECTVDGSCWAAGGHGRVGRAGPLPR